MTTKSIKFPLFLYHLDSKLKCIWNLEYLRNAKTIYLLEFSRLSEVQELRELLRNLRQRPFNVLGAENKNSKDINNLQSC